MHVISGRRWSTTRDTVLSDVYGHMSSLGPRSVLPHAPVARVLLNVPPSWAHIEHLAGARERLFASDILTSLHHLCHDGAGSEPSACETQRMAEYVMQRFVSAASPYDLG